MHRRFTGGSQHSVQAKRALQDLGHMPSLGPQVKCFGVPGLRPDGSILFKPKQQVFGKLPGGHIKGVHKEKA